MTHTPANSATVPGQLETFVRFSTLGPLQGQSSFQAAADGDGEEGGGAAQSLDPNQGQGEDLEVVSAVGRNHGYSLTSLTP